MREAVSRPLVLAGLLALLIAGLAGCGEKIAIPQPEGDFGIYDYVLWDEFAPDGNIAQLRYGIGGLYVLETDRLVRYDNNFVARDSVAGFGDGTALAFYDAQLLVFVWDQAAQTVSWHDAVSLETVGSQVLSDPGHVTHMETNPAGIAQAPWAETFLYLSDHDASVVDRYTFDLVNGLQPFGVLTTPSGAGARFAHVPAGLLTDIEGRLLVCDQDTARNWVIRFDSTPDTTDVTPDTTDVDPLRGNIFPFRDSGCINPPAGDFVLGSAPVACTGSGGWIGGPSDADGEFDGPAAAARDGLGRLFVVDRNNDRFQVFSPNAGYDDWTYDFQFGTSETLADPLSIGVVDIAAGSTPFYGAFVFVHLEESNRILKFISTEYKAKLEEENPPEELP